MEVGLSLLCVVCVCMAGVDGSRLIPAMYGMCLFGDGCSRSLVNPAACL